MLRKYHGEERDHTFDFITFGVRLVVTKRRSRRRGFSSPQELATLGFSTTDYKFNLAGFAESAEKYLNDIFKKRRVVIDHRNIQLSFPRSDYGYHSFF